MPQPVYINGLGAISNTEDVEEDLETPTGENLFFSTKVGNKVFELAPFCSIKFKVDPI